MLVGAGPGEAGLITVAGAQWLSLADTVVYDRLVNPALLKLCREDAELINVGKGGPECSVTQEEVTRLLVENCRKNRLVVRLKGGDPLIFGRGGEEAEALEAAGIPFRIVPGVTAGAGAAAYAGIPLTDRRYASTVAFVTGHEDAAKAASSINWPALAGIDTVVFYMGVANLPAIAERLMGAGRPGTTPAAVVERGTTARQRTVVGTLATLAGDAAKAGIRPPALVIVGGVVLLRERLAWFDRLPLFGRTVLVTRTRRQASELAARFGEMGAEVIEAPTISVQPPESFEPVDAALRGLKEFDWLVLTSPNGVDAVFERMRAIGLDARALGAVRVAAVGPATAAALDRRSVRADLVPQEATTEALGRALLAGESLGRKRVLLAQADLATPQLADALTKAGAAVEEVAVYRTVRPPALAPEAIEALRGGRVDWITFTSSSTVENFLALTAGLGADLEEVRLGTIGPVTAATLESHGLTPTVVAATHTIEGLVDAVVSYEMKVGPRGGRT